MSTQQTRAFQAYAKGCSVTAAFPSDAAHKFFSKFPNKRKCNIIEGTTDGTFFTIRFSLNAHGEKPRSYKDVTRASIRDLIGELPAIDPTLKADQLQT